MAVSNYTATTTSGTVIAANPDRQQLVITNTGSVNVFLNVGATAAAPGTVTTSFWGCVS
jgi:hypothetical protein